MFRILESLAPRGVQSNLNFRVNAAPSGLIYMRDSRQKDLGCPQIFCTKQLCDSTVDKKHSSPMKQCRSPVFTLITNDANWTKPSPRKGAYIVVQLTCGRFKSSLTKSQSETSHLIQLSIACKSASHLKICSLYQREKKIGAEV